MLSSGGMAEPRLATVIEAAPVRNARTSVTAWLPGVGSLTVKAVIIAAMAPTSMTVSGRGGGGGGGGGGGARAGGGDEAGGGGPARPRPDGAGVARREPVEGGGAE